MQLAALSCITRAVQPTGTKGGRQINLGSTFGLPAKHQHRLNAVSHLGLSHDVRHVVLYGPLGKTEAVCNLFVCHASRDKRKDFLLAECQITYGSRSGTLGPLAHLNQRPRREAGRHIGSALEDGAHRLNHLGSAASLQYVAPRAGLQRRRDVQLAFGGGEHDGTYAWAYPGDAGSCFNAAAWQADIEQHDIRAEFLRDL